MRMVTREKADEVIARYASGQSKRSIARALGISDSTVGRIVNKHEHGIPQSYGKYEEAVRKREYIRSRWCVLPAAEIAADLGCDESLVYKVAWKLGLEYPKDWVESRRKISLGNLVGSHSKEACAKRGRTYSETYRKEKMRVKYGLEQRTRLKIPSISKKAYNARKNLEYNFNYFPIEGDEYALGYDSETRRIVDKPKYNEEYYSKKYGLKFIEGEE